MWRPGDWSDGFDGDVESSIPEAVKLHLTLCSPIYCVKAVGSCICERVTQMEELRGRMK